MADTFDMLLRLVYAPGGEPRAHPDLRPKLVELAEQQGTNMTAVAIEILAARYKVAVDVPKGRRAAAPDATEMLLRLPVPLYTAISRVAARRARWTAQDEALAALHAYFGLSEPAKPPRRRRAARAPRPQAV